jgi:membrane protease YdiL (CAAX protease family)
MKSALVRSSALGYAVLLGVSLSLAMLGGRLGEIFGYPGLLALGARLTIGCLLAGAVLAASGALRGTFGWARRLEEEFRLLVSPLTWGEAAFLAVASGFVEELFFRAILQPELGLWLTSLLFGLLHYPMNRRMVAWTGLAAVMGLVFGVVYLRTGSLLAVSVAHGLVNFVELRALTRPASREK